MNFTKIVKAVLDSSRRELSNGGLRIVVALTSAGRSSRRIRTSAGRVLRRTRTAAGCRSRTQTSAGRSSRRTCTSARPGGGRGHWPAGARSGHRLTRSCGGRRHRPAGARGRSGRQLAEAHGGRVRRPDLAVDAASWVRRVWALADRVSWATAPRRTEAGPGG